MHWTSIRKSTESHCLSYRRLLLFLINDFVGARGYLELIVVFLDERVDVALLLLLENLVNGNKDTRFLYVAKAIVDGSSEEFHRRRKTHIGIHQRGNIVAQLSDFAIQDAIVFTEGILAEKLFQLRLVSFNNQRGFIGIISFSLSSKYFLRK